MERIETQAYQLELHNSWCIHPVLHVSLLKQLRESLVKQVPEDMELEDVERPEYIKVEKILQ